jgi:hypothetical protein
MRAHWDRRLQRIKEIAEAIGEKARDASGLLGALHASRWPEPRATGRA